MTDLTAGVPVVSDSALPAIVQAMLRPEFYPNRPASLEFRQTHISYVFLAGDLVYKVKKPVRFSFLDCSRLADRRRFCHEEVRLNRRLAPDIYLGVVPILSESGRFILGDTSHEDDPRAVEYAVLMRRIPDERMFSHIVADGRADSQMIRSIAERIACFHDGCSREHAWTYGSAAAVWQNIIGNIAECEAFAGSTITRAEFDTIDGYAKRFISATWDTLNDRARAGRVVEGHGDLRCEHIAVDSAKIEIIDCVEFSEALRYVDVASDIAFLAMDLDRLGAPAIADEFLRDYLEISSDDGAAEMVRLYKTHRAVVRGKVASLKSLAPEVAPDERDRARRNAHQCFALASEYARRAAPTLIVVCGKSGTGKSTVARALGLHLSFGVINSDRVRKRLAGLARTERVRAAYDEGIYAPEFTRRTYDTMLAEAESALHAGRGVILDATFRDAAWRASATGCAGRVGVPILFVECRADETLVMRRLAARVSADREVSDATPEIYRRQSAEFAALDEVPESNRIVIDTSQNVVQLLVEIERALTRLLERTAKQSQPQEA